MSVPVSISGPFNPLAQIPAIILATSRLVHFGFRLLSQSMSCHLILELEPAKSGIDRD